MESPQRRSAIPIPKSKLSLKKHMSKSSDDLLGDSGGSGSDLDPFMLLEENIALKEQTENLLSHKNSRMFLPIDLCDSKTQRYRLTSFGFFFVTRFTVIQKNVHLGRENNRLNYQLKDVCVQQNQLREQLHKLSTEYQKDKDNQRTKENIQVQQNKTINE